MGNDIKMKKDLRITRAIFSDVLCKVAVMKVLDNFWKTIPVEIVLSTSGTSIFNEKQSLQQTCFEFPEQMLFGTVLDRCSRMLIVTL